MGNPPLLLSRQADRRCKLHLASQRRSVACSATASSALSGCKFLFSTLNHCRSIRFSSNRAKRFCPVSLYAPSNLHLSLFGNIYLPVSFSQVIPSTWPWATSGVTSRRCLRPLWSAMPPCLSATMRERSDGSSWQLWVTQHIPVFWTLTRYGGLLFLHLRRWRSYWQNSIWTEGASLWAPAGWEHVWTPWIEQQNMSPGGMRCVMALPCCVSGVHEARCAALPGAAEGPAGHRLVGLSAGLLHGTSGPAEISQTQG